MDTELDLQRDHVHLIRSTLLKLAPDGLLIFSTNFRKFRLDGAGLGDLDVKDVTAATIPKDFARNARIHQCFEIRVPKDAVRAPRPVLSIRHEPGADE
jgi:23S rRNA (guanine2445-N2)-methyltransferase / 23S rRNA (guanine2069-N7)-methyltransferase